MYDSDARYSVFDQILPVGLISRGDVVPGYINHLGLWKDINDVTRLFFSKFYIQRIDGRGISEGIDRIIQRYNK